MKTNLLMKVILNMTNRPDIESLTDGVTGFDSLFVPAGIKPVVKTTPEEAVSLRKSGMFGDDKVVWKASRGVAYIIDKEAIHTLIGGDTLQDSINIAKKWLKAGGDSESELLGYPAIDGVELRDTIDIGVSKDGSIITDLTDMRDKVSNGKMAWAARGLPEEATSMANKVSSVLNKYRQTSINR